MSKNAIMGHLVIGYPSLKESYKTAIEYIQAGIEILELQIPFSHPTADGSTITEANRKAIENNVSVEESLEQIKRIKKEYPEQNIVPMTYLNKVFSYGFDNYVQFLNNINIDHVIIPDLPFDDKHANIIHESPVNLVPVIAANLSSERLQKLFEHPSDYIYIMSGYKITGQKFDLHPDTKALIEELKTRSNASIGIGFGINNRSDVEEVLKHADFAIIGSSLINANKEGKLQEKLQEVV